MRTVFKEYEIFSKTFIVQVYSVGGIKRAVVELFSGMSIKLYDICLH